jgi:hypothetical protein
MGKNNQQYQNQNQNQQGKEDPNANATAQQSANNNSTADNVAAAINAAAPGTSPAQQPVVEPVVQPAIQVLAPNPAIIVNDQTPLRNVETVGVQLTGLAAGFIEQLHEYRVKMHPAIPIDPVAGARMQVALFRTLVNMINNSADQFHGAFFTTLAIFHKHREEAFGEKSIARFSNLVQLNTHERETFHALLNMFVCTANPAKNVRDLNLKMIDFDKTFRRGFITEQGKQRVLAFYNLDK